MVFSAFVVLGYGNVAEENAPAVDMPAKALAGEREVTITISNMFETYKKSTDYSELGRWNGTMGLNSYMYLRTAYYEYMLREEYPFAMVYNPYSTMTSPDISAGNLVTSWYRQYIDANNITEVATGGDPIFVPLVGPISDPGGWVNISWYSTYLTTAEMEEIRNDGTHYANTYYGVLQRTTPGQAQDDGYWHELQGKMTFTRDAAKKFLGMAATGDLQAEYTTEQGAIESMWLEDWLNEGATIYDSYTAYDFVNDIRMVKMILDPDFVGTDPDTLHLRFWSMSWGNEVQLIRYLEAAGVMTKWQAWPDDYYLNLTLGPNMGDIDSRSVNGYHLTAQKDMTSDIGGWALEAVHMDWCGNDAPLHLEYPSPYNIYDPDQTDVTHVTYIPGAVNYGVETSYYLAPQEWDLQAGEKLIIELPPEEVIGYTPYQGSSDVLNQAKMDELNAHSYPGTLIMGNGWPNSGPTDLKNYYDEPTKTITLEGPIDFPRNVNGAYPTLLDTGSPTFFFDVSTSIPGSFTLNLVAGWNLVSVPLVNHGYTAGTLGLMFGDVVAGWDPATQTYDKGYIVGISPPAADFAIEPSVGYWIYAGMVEALVLSGDIPTATQTKSITVPTGGGWALVSLASMSTAWYASDIPVSYSGSITLVAAYDPVTQVYTAYYTGLPFTDYSLVPGQGYWCWCDDSGVLTYDP